MNKIYSILLLLAVLYGGESTQVHAAGNEARCDALGTNCVCSNPLNSPTSGYSNTGTGASFWWKETAVTTKACHVQTSTDGFIETNSFYYTGDSSGAAINALPAGHSNTYVLHSNNGMFGFTGTIFPATPTQRVALRAYRYESSDYVHTGGVCTNSDKVFQLGSPGPISTYSGGPALYSWNSGAAWTSDTAGQPADCCWYGPGDVAFQGEGTSMYPGKWFYWEMVVRNTTTTGQTIIEIYRRNVTDNTSRQKIIDTSVATTQSVGDQWTSTIAASLSPPSRVDEIWFDFFRHTAVCAGTGDLAYLMAAAWDTDAGQMIGAASEIEGAGGSSTSGGASGVFRMQGVVTIQ